jgi:hypothetical protein
MLVFVSGFQIESSYPTREGQGMRSFTERSDAKHHATTRQYIIKINGSLILSVSVARHRAAPSTAWLLTGCGGHS